MLNSGFTFGDQRLHELLNFLWNAVVGCEGHVTWKIFGDPMSVFGQGDSTFRHALDWSAGELRTASTELDNAVGFGLGKRR